jgi:hypothetical protein
LAAGTLSFGGFNLPTFFGEVASSGATGAGGCFFTLPAPFVALEGVDVAGAGFDLVFALRVFLAMSIFQK